MGGLEIGVVSSSICLGYRMCLMEFLEIQPETMEKRHIFQVFDGRSRSLNFVS